MNRKIHILIYIAAIVLCLVGLFQCGYYMPLQTGLISKINNGVDMSAIQIMELLFYWLCSLPCFLILILIIKTAIKINKDNVFDSEISRYMKVSGIILLIDCSVFFISNLIFTIISKTVDYKITYLLLSIVGAAIGGLLFYGSSILNKSIEYKEDSESIV